MSKGPVPISVQRRLHQVAIVETSAVEDFPGAPGQILAEPQHRGFGIGHDGPAVPLLPANEWLEIVELRTENFGDGAAEGGFQLSAGFGRNQMSMRAQDRKSTRLNSS